MDTTGIAVLRGARRRIDSITMRQQFNKVQHQTDWPLMYKLGVVLLFVLLGSVSTALVLEKGHTRTASKISDELLQQQTSRLLAEFNTMLMHRSDIVSTAALMLPPDLLQTTSMQWQQIKQLLSSGSSTSDLVQLELFVAHDNNHENTVIEYSAGDASNAVVSREFNRPLGESIAPRGINAFKLESYLFSTLAADPPENEHMPSRRDENYSAALLARESGRPSATISQSRNLAEGTLLDLYIPLFRLESTWTQQDRLKHFSGVLVARLDSAALFESLVRISPVQIIRVSAGGHTLYTQGQSSLQLVVDDEFTTQELSTNAAQLDWQLSILRPVYPGYMPVSSLFNSAPLTGLIFGLLFAAIFILIYRGCNHLKQLQLEKQVMLSRELAVARRMNADLESFAYIVSHDLKEPLVGAITLCDLLMEETTDDSSTSTVTGCQCSEEIVASSKGKKLAQYTTQISRQLDNMNDLIKGIHQYSIVGHGNEIVETVDSRNSVLEVAASLSVADHRLKISNNLPVLQTYRVRFEQTLANLIGNAFKYHHDPANANVSVSVGSYGNFYSFEITDDGPGIDPRNHERIFEVFESIRDEKTEGSGVGLSIVKKAVESLGGVVTVESDLGSGTTFRFLWPKNVVCEEHGIAGDSSVT